MTSRWWPAVVVAVAILALSLIPLDGGGAVSTVSDGSLAGIGADKLLHVVDYAALALALLYASRARSARACLLAFVAVVAVGGAVELLQVPLPTRHGSLLDAGANAIGAAAASVGWWLVRGEPGAVAAEPGDETPDGSENG